jgi:CzcA family heavy metal efflux pump
MLRGIVSQSLNFRFLIVVIAVVLMLFGIVRLRDMPLGVLPEFSPPYVEVQTEALGLSAGEVEQLITIPMEQDLLNGVAWLEEIRSESVPGLSSIVLFFEPGTDVYRARQMVAERLTQAAVGIPQVSKPPTMLQPLSSTSRFVIVGLSSDELSLIELSVLARWTIGPQLMGVPGVANVGIWGQRERQLQVQVDPDRLRAQGVTLQQILESTGNALWVSSLTFLEGSTPGTGGFIDTANQRLGIWHVLPISSPEELAQVPVEDTAGLRLADVAKVVENHPLLIGDAVLEAGPSLLLVVEKLPGVNTLEVTQGVEAALDALRPGLPGVEMDTTVYRPATFIETALDNLTRTLLLGAVVLVVVLLAFFWDVRSALISLVVIPVSLMAALLVLDLRGSTLNSIVLAGLVVALAAIIDDAIVDVENIRRRLRRRRDDGRDLSVRDIIIDASVEVRGAMIFATFILVLVVVPVFFLSGLTGTFFSPLAGSYALAVLASLVVALTLTPALSSILLFNAPLERRRSPLRRWLQGTYERALSQSVQKTRLAYVTVAILVLAGGAVLILLSQSVSPLPEFKERDIKIDLDGAAGTSRPEMNRIVARVSNELRAIPGVRNVAAHVGRAILGDQVVGINSSELWVSIEPGANYDATLAQIQETVDGYPGLQNNVQTYLNEITGAIIEEPSEDLTVRVFGEQQEILSDVAEKVKNSLLGIEGIYDAYIKYPVERPTLEIEVDLESAQRYGINPGDVRRTAATLVSGLQVGSLFEEQKVFEVLVWSTPETRSSLSDVHELLIDTPGGGRVRLDEVADVRVASSPIVMQRIGVSPYLEIAANVSGRNLGAVTSDVRRTLRGFEFPLEYHAELVVERAERQAAQQRVLFAAAFAAIGVFLLLQAAFDDWRLAALVFLTLPVALTGGLLAAFVSGGAFALGSLAGLLALLGIAVRNSTMLINHYQHLGQFEDETFGPALVLRGSRERLAPIVMTTLAIGLALLPVLLFGGSPGHEILQPMAVVILGGLVTSAWLNLFILPTLYLRFGFSPESVAVLSPEPVSSS